MKNLAAILFLLLYCPFAFGASISKHHCNSQPNSINQIKDCKCAPGQKKHCCENKIYVLHADDHTVSFISAPAQAPVIFHLISNPIELLKREVVTITKTASTHSPPPLTKGNAFLSFIQVYRL